MALTIKDIVAASYAAVVTESGKAANQWAENGVLRAFDRKGFIKKEDLGRAIEAPLDYAINAGAEFLASDITPTSLNKTSILGSASYSIAEVSVPMVWTKKDDATNPTKNQKVAYVKGLYENGRQSHDATLEAGLFASAATQGFESLRTLITEDGEGTVGTINAAVDTMWKNQFKDYDTGATLLADMTTVASACAKASGGMEPSLIVTSPVPYGLFEGKLVANQRFSNKTDADAGFQSLKFHGADVIFSFNYADESFFFLNPKAVKLVVSRSHFRHRGDINEIDDVNGYVTKLYTATQLVTNNRSRLGVLFT